MAAATTWADACHGMHPGTLPACPGCCLLVVRKHRSRGCPVLLVAAEGASTVWGGYGAAPWTDACFWGPVSGRLALCGSSHLARQRAWFRAASMVSAVCAVQAAHTEQMPQPAKVFRPRGSHHLSSCFQSHHARGVQCCLCWQGQSCWISQMLEKSPGWPILNLLFSHRWQWVERMADLDVWLLCCWGLGNVMQLQAGQRCALWPPCCRAPADPHR